MLTPPLIIMTMVGMLMDWVKNMSLLIGTHKPQRDSGAKLPKAPKNLESGDVGLKFQLKMFEFMDFMNQELNYG